MDKIIDFVNKIMGRETNPPVFAPGMYAFSSPENAPIPFKLHLRLRERWIWFTHHQCTYKFASEPLGCRVCLLHRSWRL